MRRRAWEQELEAKYQQRQAETECQLAEMERQIAYLRACVALFLHHRREATHVAGGSGYILDEPGSPSPALPPGSTSLEEPFPSISPGNVISGRSHNRDMLVDAPSPSASPHPSNRKRPTPTINRGDSDSDNSDSQASVSSTGKRPQKRINNHDKTCYTIQVFHTIDSVMTAENFRRPPFADTFSMSWGFKLKMTYLLVISKDYR